MQAPCHLELWYQVPGHSLRSGTCCCGLQAASRPDPGTTPRPAHVARERRYMPHLLVGMKALAGAPLGRPLWATRRTVSSPRWWDWPQSGSVVTWQPRPVIQCGPRLCQVDSRHSIFLHQSPPAYCCTTCPCAPDLRFVFYLRCTVSCCIVFFSRWAFRRMLMVCGIVGCA